MLPPRCLVGADKSLARAIKHLTFFYASKYQNETSKAVQRQLKAHALGAGLASD